MEQERKSRWRRLDNTAKIFPVIANENMSQVFRLSAVLKEEVRPDVLQKALDGLLPHMREFWVKLRRGLFWYYFEENRKLPLVQRESTYPCRYFDPHGNQKFLFRVTYYKNRINLEVFHALTDGLGAVGFLKRLVVCYLNLLRRDPESWPWMEEWQGGSRRLDVEDSYLEHCRGARGRTYSSRPAFRLEGHYLPLGSGQVLHGYMRVDAVKQVCHGFGVSVTKYLAAVLIWSIWKEYGGEDCKRPVVLNLPINLRSLFGSETMSNFFAVTMIGYLFRNPEVSFETLLAQVSRQMDRKTHKERLRESIAYNVSNEKKWYLRIIPLIGKAPVLALLFRLKDRAYTMTLSNVGVITLDPKYADAVERFQMMIGVSRRQPVKCAVCAYGEEIAVTFTSVFSDSRLQKRFFGKLREDGVEVRLEGNELSHVRKTDSYPRVRRIWIRKKGGEEKASRMVRKAGKTGESAARGVWDFLSGRKSWQEELSRRFHL